MSASPGALAARPRIGLFGGSFDPVHVGHVALARATLDQLSLDELRWVPAGQPWQKARRLTAPDHRAAMVQLAIEGEPRFVLDRSELDRSGPSYTLDTVRLLQAAQPGGECFLLIGADQYANLHTWHGWGELLQRVTLAVAGRQGSVPRADPALAAVPHRVAHVDLPPVDASSTEIRTRLAAGENAASLVPHLLVAPVAGYIARNHLYQQAS